jgi:hypothetical protein
LGGHGYVREWGIEQIVRDSRVAMIYEGTNEIQAIDLLVRKVLTDGGVGLMALLQELSAPLDCLDVADKAFKTQVTVLSDLTTRLALASAQDRQLPYWAADDYLRAVALTLLAWAWTQIREAVSSNGQDTQAVRWRLPAAALQHWILPEFTMRVQMIAARLP